MDDRSMPLFFYRLLSEACINKADIINATDGFFFVYKSLSDILSEKGVLDFPDSDGTRLACSSFFDDWFLYAVPRENDFEYSLLKLREQEHDARNGKPADGDMPGVTVSFISFQCEELLDCLQNPTDENIKELCEEINRVVVCKIRGILHNSIHVYKAYCRTCRKRLFRGSGALQGDCAAKCFL